MISRTIPRIISRCAAPLASRRLIYTGPRSFPAWFVRSGTSNGLVIRRDALPANESEWQDILPAAMGSGDAVHARQLDGMGSGTSSTAKIVLLAPGKDGHDVEYTIVQAGVRDTVLDQAGNCGNMTAVVGPAAWDMGYVSKERKPNLIEEEADGEQWATIKTFNTNTSKTIDLRFRVAGNPPVYCPEGDYAIAGVAGTHSRITMSFLDPAGAKTGKQFPTGNKIDTLKLKDGSEIEASLVDVGNPGVFIRATAMGFPESGAGLNPEAVEADQQLKTRLEEIRQAGATAMGMDPSMGSVPKVVMVYPAEGEKKDIADICCLAMSMGQAHKAAPLTLALCLGAAAQIQGTLPAEMLSEGSRGKDVVRIAHPSGQLDVSTRRRQGEGDDTIEAAQLLRTARVMMKGDVYY